MKFKPNYNSTLEWAKSLSRLAARLVFGPLGRLEDMLLPDYQLAHSPVFIIGPPRSGTTMLCQLLNYALATCYFGNLASRLRVQGIRNPPVVLSAWLTKLFRLMDKRVETFKSDYGRTRWLGNPSDSVMIWQHWFPNRYIDTGEFPADARRAVYQAVAGTERVFGRPFVDKTVENCTRLRALVEIFPTALFIRCSRNPLAVAQSSYIARLKTESPQDHWWPNTRPREYETLRHKSIVEQICGQVYFLEQNIAQGLAVVSPERILTINYKSVCMNPQHEINRIADFMNSYGACTEQIRSIPAQFPYSGIRRIPVAKYQALIEHLESLYGRQMTRLEESL